MESTQKARGWRRRWLAGFHTAVAKCGDSLEFVVGMTAAVRLGMAHEDLRPRTKRFSLQVIALWRRVPKTKDYQQVGDHLLRAAESVANNYRAARCGRSHAEFTAKLGTVREEADECQHCLDMLAGMGLQDQALPALQKEASELLAIFISSLKTARQHQNERGNQKEKRKSGRGKSEGP